MRAAAVSINKNVILNELECTQTILGQFLHPPVPALEAHGSRVHTINTFAKHKKPSHFISCPKKAFLFFL